MSKTDTHLTPPKLNYNYAGRATPIRSRKARAVIKNKKGIFFFSGAFLVFEVRVV